MTGKFYLLVSKPLKLPSGAYLVVMNVEAEGGHLSDINAVDYSIEGDEQSICRKNIEEQLVAETRLKEWSGKTIKARIYLNSSEFLECYVDLANEEQRVVFVSGGKTTYPEYKKNTKVAATERLRDLVDLIKGDMELLNDYEKKLRYEDEPSFKHKYLRKIQELHESIDNHEKEYHILIEGASTETAITEQKDSDELREIREVHAKLDQLLKIRDDINKFESTIISCLAVNEQKIIAVLRDRFERLEQNELVMVNAVLSGVDAMDITADRIEETIASIHKALVEVRGAVSDPIMSKTAGEVLAIVDDPNLDVKHRLKVSVPIIPLILSYEGIVAFESKMNLRKAWEWLVDKVQRRKNKGSKDR